MKRTVVTVFVLALVTAFVGSAVAQSGMMGQSPQPKGDKPSEQSSQAPVTPELAARMINACIGAMEGMAQMGRMMGGQGSTPQKPSEERQ